MKKSIKMMALGLAVLPCALALTACGGNGDEENLVDIGGDYVKVEAENNDALVEELDAGFNLEEIAKNGMQQKMTVSVNGSMGNMGAVKLNLSADALFFLNPSEENTFTPDGMEGYMGLDFNANIGSGKNKMEMNGNLKQWIVNGNQYIDMSGAEQLLGMMGGMDMPTKYYQQFVTESEVVTLPDYTVSDLFAMIPEGTYGDYMTFEKSTTETGFKVKVTANSEALNALLPTDTGVNTNIGDVVMYMIYDNNEFQGLYLDAELSINATFEQGSEEYEMYGSNISMNVNLNYQISGYEGTIDYPSFNGFVDVTYAE